MYTSPEHKEELRQAEAARRKTRAEWKATMSIQDFRDATMGEGPLADTYDNSPGELILDLCNAVDNASVPVFSVHAEDSERPPLRLGYATGKQEDIKAFFDDRKAYGLLIEQVNVQHIPAGFANRRQELIQQRDKYQGEIERINQQLRHIGA